MKILSSILIFLSVARISWSADILMVTMGGTKSHKIPFWELAKGLIPRGHNVTFLNGFPADFTIDGLHEITPAGLVDYIQNYTNWDLVGARISGKMPITPWDAVRYTFQSCDAMLNDAETIELLNRTFDLIIMDGAFPECALGLGYKFKIPYMYINTVAFYLGSMSVAGNPTPFSITPNFYSSYSDNMNIIERLINTAYHVTANILHSYFSGKIHNVLKKHFGNEIPHVYELAKNVSFILQYGHSSILYPHPYLPNIAEVPCIHCKPARSLSKELETFINDSGKSGFIYVSMGSSVKDGNMPEQLRQLMVKTFARLPYYVLWKWDGSTEKMRDLPPNVMIKRWLPQQDILGHKKLRAFVTHGGLLSMYETIYHGVPIVTIPVFCDQDMNAAKAELDGYAIKLDLQTLTSDELYKSINRIIHDTRYKKAVKVKQSLLLDQKIPPLESAIYWTEYVLRHNGAYHLQTPARNLSWIQYYLVDVVIIYLIGFYLTFFILRRITKHEVIESLSSKKQKLP